MSRPNNVGRPAGPRGAIVIDRAAAEASRHGVAPAKVRAYIEVGRLLVLELMGCLASYYLPPPAPAGLGWAAPGLTRR
ncbi:MAG TPA: hypothetical protein VGF55_33330 [Gemmataceae bacterium]|jgi:hypothetical protein